MKPTVTSRPLLPLLLVCLTLPWCALRSGTALAQSALSPLPTAAAAPDWTLRPAAATQKLTATEPGALRPFVPTPVLLQAVRGQWVSFQFVVTAGNAPLQDLTVATDGMASITADVLAPGQFNFYRENFVYIPHPSGNRNLQKLWWPDALLPWELAPRTIEAHQSAVYWVALKIPENAAPTDYFGELQLSGQGGARRLALTVTVKDAAMPPPRFRANAALYYDNLREWYGKNLQREYTRAEWTVQKKLFYEFLLDYRINAYDLPVAWTDAAAATYLRDARVHSVRLPHLEEGGLPEALSVFKSNGAAAKAYYYWNDEPGPEAYTRVRADAAKLHSLGVRQCVTAFPNSGLKDAVDIWCANIGDFFGVGHLNATVLAAQRRAGRETWLYTMVEPRAPYPTWLVDDDGAAIARYFEIVKAAGATGFVYSMVHGWGPRPLQDITSYAGTNGDGTLLYPAEALGGHGPLPSIRLMLLREAIQNWELENALPHSVPNKIASTGLIPTQPTAQNFMYGSPPLASRPPVIDGHLDDPCWNGPALMPGRFTRAGYAVDAGLDSTRCWLTAQGTNLFVAIRADRPATGEWLAVEIAPPQPDEKLQFQIRANGKVHLERWTREGHFEVDVPGLLAKAWTSSGFWVAEMKIPLGALGYGKSVRFNVVRRTTDPASGTRVTLRARPDANDPWSMPLLSLR